MELLQGMQEGTSKNIPLLSQLKIDQKPSFLHRCLVQTGGMSNIKWYTRGIELAIAQFIQHVYSIKASAFVTIIAMWFFMELSFGSHLVQCVQEEQGQPRQLHSWNEKTTARNAGSSDTNIKYCCQNPLFCWECNNWLHFEYHQLKSKRIFLEIFQSWDKDQCWSPLFCWNTCWMDTWTMPAWVGQNVTVQYVWRCLRRKL